MTTNGPQLGPDIYTDLIYQSNICHGIEAREKYELAKNCFKKVAVARLKAVISASPFLQVFSDCQAGWDSWLQIKSVRTSAPYSATLSTDAVSVLRQPAPSLRQAIIRHLHII